MPDLDTRGGTDLPNAPAFPVPTDRTARLGTCRLASCAVPVVFAKNPKTDRWIPLDLRTLRRDGEGTWVATSHFACCQDPDRFRRRASGPIPVTPSRGRDSTNS